MPAVSMGKTSAEGTRVPARKTVRLGDLLVKNETANSILVQRTAKGLVVTDCCLEEQGK